MALFTAPAIPERLSDFLEFIRSECAVFSFADDGFFRLLLAAEEAVVNVIRHAYGPEGGVLQVAVVRAGDFCKIVLSDQGEAFDPLQQEAPDSTAPLEARLPGGWGIPLIIKNVDNCRYERRDGENRLELYKRLAPGQDESG